MVEEVFVVFLVAEEEPVFSICLVFSALFDEGSEWCDTCAGADHDDGCVAVFWEAEVFIFVEVDVYFCSFGSVVCEVGGCDSFAFFIVGLVADSGDCKVDLVWVCCWAGCDGVEARGECAEAVHELLCGEGGWESYELEEVDDFSSVGPVFEAYFFFTCDE